MLYKDNLCFMHDLSWNWVCNEIWYFEIFYIVGNEVKLESILQWLNFKAYYGFRVLYVFPFPSAGHWPWFQVVTKLVSEQWFHCWSWNCHFVFSYSTAVIGCQMSVLSSLLLVFCVVSASLLCFDFIWFVFSEWEVEHEMLLLLKQLIMLSSPFKAKLLLLLLDVKEEVAVVEECCLILYMFWEWNFFYEWNCWLDYMLLWLLEMSKIRLWVFIRGW